jgi:hypothetical protein
MSGVIPADDGLVGRMVLAEGWGAPIVQLLEVESGLATPIPSPSIGEGAYGAFDTAVAREGWTAVKLGYTLVAYLDGDPLHPRRLPDAWFAVPAIEPGRLLVRRYHGASLAEGELEDVAVVGPDGGVHRAARFPVLAGSWGEVHDGVIATRTPRPVDGFGVRSWHDGSFTPLPVAGWPIGTLGGHVVVVARETEVEAIDLEGGTSRVCSVPALKPNPSLHARYDQTATRLVASRPGEPAGVLVVELESGPRWLPVEGPCGNVPVWLGERWVLFTDGRVMDTMTGAVTQMRWRPRTPLPRVEVTGRFDLAAIKAVLRPPRWSSPTPEERDNILASSRRSLESAATASTSAFVRLASPAVRLRSCVARPRIPVGGSRLGGRPDLPAGYRWPKGTHGRPMVFVAQLNLRDVNAAAVDSPLPAAGSLVVFADLDEAGVPTDGRAARVSLIDDRRLNRARWPSGLSDELRFQAAELLPEPLLTLPTAPRQPATEFEADWSALRDVIAAPAPRHQMFGHAWSYQELDAAFTVGGPWALLLQVEQDGIAGFTFADSGRLHFWVPSGPIGIGDVECIIEVDSY